MSENVPPRRSGRAKALGKTVITFGEATELRRLYGELPNAAAEARQALKVASGEALTGEALARLRESDARLLQIVDRIKAILG